MASLSPLRYPGGKSKAVDFLTTLMPSGITKIISPFFGRGSFELAMANSGIEVIGYDVFLPLVNFWQCLNKNPHHLADLVEKYHPLSKDKFYEIQKSKCSFGFKYNRAAMFFVLNRASFSGSTLSGGMSPNHPRFTESSINKLRRFSIKNFSVNLGSFEETIVLHNDLFYADPPYLIDMALYGNKGSTHKDFDHNLLCSILKKRDKWILSYNNCDEIRKMYSGYLILEPQWKYGMGKNKNSYEVVILSKDIGELN